MSPIFSEPKERNSSFGKRIEKKRGGCISKKRNFLEPEFLEIQ